MFNSFSVFDPKSVNTNGFPYISDVPPSIYHSINCPETAEKCKELISELIDTICDINEQIELAEIEIKLDPQKETLDYYEWKKSAVGKRRFCRAQIKLLRAKKLEVKHADTDGLEKQIQKLKIRIEKLETDKSDLFHSHIKNINVALDNINQKIKKEKSKRHEFYEEFLNFRRLLLRFMFENTRNNNGGFMNYLFSKLVFVRDAVRSNKNYGISYLERNDATDKTEELLFEDEEMLEGFDI